MFWFRSFMIITLLFSCLAFTQDYPMWSELNGYRLGEDVTRYNLALLEKIKENAGYDSYLVSRYSEGERILLKCISGKISEITVSYTRIFIGVNVNETIDSYKFVYGNQPVVTEEKNGSIRYTWNHGKPAGLVFEITVNPNDSESYVVISLQDMC